MFNGLTQNDVWKYDIDAPRTYLHFGTKFEPTFVQGFALTKRERNCARVTIISTNNVWDSDAIIILLSGRRGT